MRKCIKCGNFYLSEPDSGDEMCFRCEMEEKDTKIAELEAKLAESEKEADQRYKDWQEEIRECDRLRVLLAEMTKKYELASCPTGGLVDRVRKLEQQLEEKDEELNSARVGEQFALKCCNEAKQQLAEKEKEIETIKKDSDKNIDYLVEFASLIENEKDCNRMLKALDRVKKGKKYIIDQSKTEFAIQQLQRVKEKALHFYVNDTPKLTGYYVDTKEIDQRIKELEGE